MTVREGMLVLADGSTFEGELIGAEAPGGVATGEVVFNTVLSGYQEVLSDPSYAGQVITFTYPHIGNYGVNPTDDESRRPFCRGVVVRDLARRRSNWRATDDLDAYLARHGVPGIAGLDTRRLTRHIREAGALPGAFGDADEVTLKAAAVGRAGHRRLRPGRRGHHRRGLRRGRHRPGHGQRPAHRGLRLRHQDDDPAPPRRPGRGHGRAGRHAGGRRPGPHARRRVPGQRPRRPGGGDLRGASHPRPARRGADLRHLPGPPAAVDRARWCARRSCRSATTAATTRSAASPPAGSRSPARTTTTRWSRARWAPRSRSPTSTSTTA